MLQSIIKATKTGIGYTAGHIASFHVKQYAMANHKSRLLPVIAATGVWLILSFILPKTEYQTGAAVKVGVTTLDAVLPLDSSIRHYLGIHPNYMLYWNNEKDKQQKFIQDAIKNGYHV